MNHDEYSTVTRNIQYVMAPASDDTSGEGLMARVWERVFKLGIASYDPEKFTINDLMIAVSMIRDTDLRIRMRFRLMDIVNDTLNWHVQNIGANNLTPEEGEK